MIGSMAIDAWVSQYASAWCRASSCRKLSASSWRNPVSPTRSTIGLSTAGGCWARSGPAVTSPSSNRSHSALTFIGPHAAYQPYPADQPHPAHETWSFSPAEEHRVEQRSECPEGLAAPFGAEPEQHDVPGVERHVERRCLSLQILLPDQIPRLQRRSRFPVAGEHRAREAILGLEHRAAVDEHHRFVGHPGHHRMRGIGGDLDDRAAQEEFLGAQAGDDIPDRQPQLLNRERAGIAQADEGAAGTDELFFSLHVGPRELIAVLGTNHTSTPAPRSTRTPRTFRITRAGRDRDARIVGENQHVNLLAERRPEIFRVHQRE